MEGLLPSAGYCEPYQMPFQNGLEIFLLVMCMERQKKNIYSRCCKGSAWCLSERLGRSPFLGNKNEWPQRCNPPRNKTNVWNAPPRKRQMPKRRGRDSVKMRCSARIEACCHGAGYTERSDSHGWKTKANVRFPRCNTNRDLLQRCIPCERKTNTRKALKIYCLMKLCGCRTGQGITERSHSHGCNTKDCDAAKA